MSSIYGHTPVNSPDPVRSPKLSTGWRSQYYRGGPDGNTACCSFPFVKFSWWLAISTPRISLNYISLFFFFHRFSLIFVTRFGYVG